MAVTRVTAGVAHNVLPQSASVTLSTRLLPGDNLDETARRIQSWLGSSSGRQQAGTAGSAAASGVHITRAPGPLLPRVADAHGPHFALLAGAIQEHWRMVPQQAEPAATSSSSAAAASRPTPLLPVIPFLLPAMTDSRHYEDLSAHPPLRWAPGSFSASGGELRSIHGVDERLALTDWACGLATYRSLLRRFGDYAAPCSGSGSRRCGEGEAGVGAGAVPSKGGQESSTQAHDQNHLEL
jgi:acetylornithine deacetylase/succinyl-diaminopimelate desuccinylase-like protein